MGKAVCSRRHFLTSAAVFVPVFDTEKEGLRALTRGPIPRARFQLLQLLNRKELDTLPLACDRDEAIGQRVKEGPSTLIIAVAEPGTSAVLESSIAGRP